MTKQIGVIVSETEDKIPFDETFQKWAKLIGDMTKEDSKDEQTEIQLEFKNIDINRCIDFCKQYELDQFVIPDRHLETKEDICNMLPEWCVNLLDITSDEVLDLMVIANFVDIESLIDVCCVKLASLMKGQGAKQIRTVVNAVDFKDEEKDYLLEVPNWFKKKKQEKNEENMPVSQEAFP